MPMLIGPEVLVSILAERSASRLKFPPVTTTAMWPLPAFTFTAVFASTLPNVITRSPAVPMFMAWFTESAPIAITPALLSIVRPLSASSSNVPEVTVSAMLPLPALINVWDVDPLIPLPIVVTRCPAVPMLIAPVLCEKVGGLPEHDAWTFSELSESHKPASTPMLIGPEVCVSMLTELVASSSKAPLATDNFMWPEPACRMSALEVSSLPTLTVRLPLVPTLIGPVKGVHVPGVQSVAVVAVVGFVQLPASSPITIGPFRSVSIATPLSASSAYVPPVTVTSIFPDPAFSDNELVVSILPIETARRPAVPRFIAKLALSAPIEITPPLLSNATVPVASTEYEPPSTTVTTLPEPAVNVMPVAVASTLRAAVNEMSLAAESIVTPVAASMSTTSAVADSTSLLAPVTATSCSTELISTPV